MATYQLWYADDLGNRLAPITDVQSFEYVKVLGDIGIGVFSIPRRGQVYDSTQTDRRVHVYRQPDGGVLSLDFTCYLREFSTTTSNTGQYVLTIVGHDLNSLLQRRIVAYYAGKAEATMTDQADDMMKAIVTDNFVDNADYNGTPSPTRSISTHGFSVASDLAAGPSITKGFSWRNVLMTCQDIQATSKTNGTEVFFGVVPTSETAMEFRTWTGQPGQDRTVTSGTNPLVFSLEWGNLGNPELAYDHGRELSYVYAGGRGEQSGRIISTASDTTRLNYSRVGRIEGFAHSVGDTTAAVTADAEDILAERRGMVTLRGDLLSTPLTPYGGLGGWGLGTKVTANMAGVQFDPIVRAVHVNVNSAGRETVRGRAESE